MQHDPFLTPELSASIVRMAHDGILREFPNKPAHLLNSAEDLQLPKQLHPAFFGCYDWHSAVHSHWTLFKLLERGGSEDRESEKLSSETSLILNRHLSQEALEVERRYFLEAGRESFERPYGWAWIWKLAADLASSRLPEAKKWAANIRPLADLLATRFVDWLHREEYPCRTGTHGNSAFAMDMGLDFSLTCAKPELESAIRNAAIGFFGRDQGATLRLEPSGNDFISPILAEMVLMFRVLPNDSWRGWMDRFLTDPHELMTLRPVTVSNRSDGQGVHLDGLNLSRAWHLRRLATTFGTVRCAEILQSSACEHWHAGSAHLRSGDFLGEHWLGTFAVLSAPRITARPAAHPIDHLK